jgi:hypothetical protein
MNEEPRAGWFDDFQEELEEDVWGEGAELTSLEDWDW